jgi:hypothetical protein
MTRNSWPRSVPVIEFHIERRGEDPSWSAAWTPTDSSGGQVEWEQVSASAFTFDLFGLPSPLR